MAKDRFEVGKMPAIELTECAGDLVVRGWSETAVDLRGNYKAEETKAGLLITAHGDLRLNVPVMSNLAIGEVHGALVLKNVHGDMSLSGLNGDVVLNDLGSVKAGEIRGDLVAKHIAGSLSIGSVHGDTVMRHIEQDVTAATIHGDFVARHMQGSLTLNEVAGDIDLHNIQGGVHVVQGHRDANIKEIGGQVMLPNIAGDIRIHGGLTEGKHQFVANGDIVLRWPVILPINLEAEAPIIVNRLPLLDKISDKGSLAGRIGVGATAVSLTASGQIVLKDVQVIDEQWTGFMGGFNGMDFGFDFADIGERIGTQVNEQVTRITEEIEQAFGADFSQRMADKMNRHADRAAAKADRAAAKAERARSRHQRRPSSAASSEPPKRSATAEEQLKILRMVEAGTISPEEANMLLKTLGN